MKYKMMADESFTDKLNETIRYVPGDMIKTEVDEERKENLVARKLAHVVEEIEPKEIEPKEIEPKEIEPKEKGAKKKASKTPTNEK